MIITPSIDAIRTAISSSHKDLYNLCVTDKAKINIWSLHKPIYYTGVGRRIRPLTENELKIMNYGLTPPIHYSKANLCVQASANGDGFTYTTPNKPFRMSDWIGYDHDATSWFTVNFVTDSVKQGNSIGADFANLDLGTISDMEYYSGASKSDMLIGFILLPTSSWSIYATTCYFYCCNTIEEVLNDDKQFRLAIPSDFSTGDYYVMPVICTIGSIPTPAQGELFEQKMYYIGQDYSIIGDWRFMPCNINDTNHPCKITITSSYTPPTPVYSLNFTVNDVQYTIDYNNNTITFSSINITIDDSSAFTHTFSLDFTLYGDRLSVSNKQSGDTFEVLRSPVSFTPMAEVGDITFSIEYVVTDVNLGYVFNGNIVVKEKD